MLEGLAHAGSRRCARPASPASPTSRLDLVEDARRPVGRRRRARRAGRRRARRAGRPAWSSCAASRSLQKVTKAFRAVAPLPRRAVGRGAVDRLRRRPSCGAGARCCADGVDRVQVDWRAARRQARAGRAAVRRQRSRSRAGDRRRAARAAAGAARGSAPQHRRRLLTPVERDGRFERCVADAPSASSRVRASRPDRPPRRGQLSQHAAAGRRPRRPARRRAALRRAGALRRLLAGRRGRPRPDPVDRVRAPRRRLRRRPRRRRSRSRGAVDSVALFTRQPIERVRPIALDTSSRTSVGAGAAAVRAPLRHRAGVRAGGAGPRARCSPSADAALLIGDPALVPRSGGARRREDRPRPGVARDDRPAVRLRGLGRPPRRRVAGASAGCCYETRRCAAWRRIDAIAAASGRGDPAGAGAGRALPAR